MPDVGVRFFFSKYIDTIMFRLFQRNFERPLCNIGRKRVGRKEGSLANDTPPGRVVSAPNEQPRCRKAGFWDRVHLARYQDLRAVLRGGQSLDEPPVRARGTRVLFLASQIRVSHLDVHVIRVNCLCVNANLRVHCNRFTRKCIYA